MIVIGKLRYRETDKTARIEANINITGCDDFELYIETGREYGKYLVTDRADAFLVGCLMSGMIKGHDIKCEDPVSSELKFLLEKQLVHTLTKYDDKLYKTKIYADITDAPIPNEGAVGTGISLGLDSFTTIAEMYDSKYPDLKLTHLMTFNNGTVGGFYMKNNWDHCAARLYERIERVAGELGLPLISVNTNVGKLIHPRVDYYVTYMIIMLVMSLGKLFKTYFISSNGEDFSHFNIEKTGLKDCEPYDLFTIYCCSLKDGVQFLSGGGEMDRVEKMQTIAKFPIARKNLQSCLTSYYNCMNCQKCKRNLVTLDALGLLDDFEEVYDVAYYKEHRNEYIEWMHWQVQMQNHASDYIKPAYEIIKKREPELIKKFDLSMEELIRQRNELMRQRNVYRKYSALFRRALSVKDEEDKLRQWFSDRNINNLILYGAGSSEATQCLISLCRKFGITISYIVEDVKSDRKVIIPRIPESTIDYPPCDAVIICNVDKQEVIRRKLSDILTIPFFGVEEVLTLK